MHTSRQVVAEDAKDVIASGELNAIDVNGNRNGNGRLRLLHHWMAVVARWPFPSCYRIL